MGPTGGGGPQSLEGAATFRINPNSILSLCLVWTLVLRATSDLNADICSACLPVMPIHLWFSVAPWLKTMHARPLHRACTRPLLQNVPTWPACRHGCSVVLLLNPGQACHHRLHMDDHVSNGSPRAPPSQKLWLWSPEGMSTCGWAPRSKREAATGNESLDRVARGLLCPLLTAATDPGSPPPSSGWMWGRNQRG